MKALAWSLKGIALGGAFFVLIGVLSIQVIGIRAGAVLDLNNEVVAVTTRRVPLLQMLAIAALCSLVMLALVFGMDRLTKVRKYLFLGSFLITLILFLGWGLSIDLGGDASDTLSGGFPVGWRGWFLYAGQSPATHVICVLSLGLIWWASTQDSRYNSPKTLSDAESVSGPGQVP